MAIIITWKTFGKAKERPKDVQLKRAKKRRGLIPFVVGNYLTHSPSNVAYTQIMKFNSNRRSRTNISRQHNFPFYSKG